MKRLFLVLIMFRMLLLVVMACGGSLRADSDAYRALSENLYANGVFGCGEIPTAYRPPLYPMLLLPAVAVERLTGSPAASDTVIAILHTLWSTVTIAGTWWLAERIVRPRSDSGPPNAVARWVPPIAAMLVTIDPILIRQAGLVMTETVATGLAVLLLLAGNPIRRKGDGGSDSGGGAGKGYMRAALTGTLYGLAVLCRPAFLPMAILATLLFAGAAVVAMRGGTINDTTSGIPGTRWRMVAVWGCFVAAMLTPISVWTARNVMDFGTPIITTTHGGYTLLLGNNADYDAWLRSDRRQPWDAENFQRELAREFSTTGGIPVGMPDPTGLRERLMADRSGHSFENLAKNAADDRGNGDLHSCSVDEVEMDRAMRRQAIATMRADPAAMGRATAARITRFWGVMPMASENESALHRAVRYGIAVFYTIVGGLTLIGVGVGIFHSIAAIRRRDGCSLSPWRRIDSRIVLCTAIVLTTAAIHSIYWTDMRMRSVIVPVLAIIAAHGFTAILKLCGTLRSISGRKSDANSSDQDYESHLDHGFKSEHFERCEKARAVISNRFGRE